MEYVTMKNEEKAREIAGYKPDEKPEIPMFQGQDGDKYACYESAMEMAEWKDAQRRTPSDDTTEGFVHIIIGEVACHETELERQIEQGKAFAEHNKTVFEVAMAVAASYSENAESQRLTIKKLNEENDKLRKELSRCRAMNADYLTAKTEAENRAKLLEKEVADLKVPESRQNRHLRDELHKVRLECQQAWGKANEELVNKATVESKLQRVIAERDKYRNFAIELGDKNEALKRQLDESNRQIEIYAKKVRNLEAELEEDGGLG